MISYLIQLLDSLGDRTDTTLHQAGLTALFNKKADLGTDGKVLAAQLPAIPTPLITSVEQSFIVKDGKLYPNDARISFPNQVYNNFRINPATGQTTSVSGYTYVGGNIENVVPGTTYVSNVPLLYAAYFNAGGQYVGPWSSDPTTATTISQCPAGPTTGLVLRVSYFGDVTSVIVKPGSVYQLPQATSSVLGGIKLGAYLTYNTITGQVDVTSQPSGSSASIYPLPEYTASSDGEQRITLSNAVTGILDINVLQLDGDVRPVYQSRYTITNGVLIISSQANIKTGDKISASYYTNMTSGGYITHDYITANYIN